jgi:hypothetical protein
MNFNFIGMIIPENLWIPNVHGNNVNEIINILWHRGKEEEKAKQFSIFVKEKATDKLVANVEYHTW